MTDLNHKYDDSVHTIIKSFCDKLSNVILDCKLPITPNMISIFRILLVLTILCYSSNFKYIAIVYLINRVLDDLDGILARKGNLQSKLGDKLDHYGDYIEVIVLAIVIFIINGKNKNVLYFIIPIFIYIYSGLPISCRQVDLNNKANSLDKKETISFISKLCPTKLYEKARVFRIFGYGISILLGTLFLWNIPMFEK